MSVALETHLDVLKRIINQEQRRQQIENFESHNHIYEVALEAIREKGLILYGGYALNAMLPKSHKIYKDRTLPDFDCFSTNARKDAEEIADRLAAANFGYVEVKKGLHKGTYKVYADFMTVADVTSVSKRLHSYLSDNSKTISGVRFCPSEFLMWSLYKEMARPHGSSHRWEKIYPRYQAFYKHNRLKGIGGSNCAEENSPTAARLDGFLRESDYVIVGQKAVSMHVEKNCKPIVEMYAFEILCEDSKKAYEEMKMYLGLELELIQPKNVFKDLSYKVYYVKHGSTRLCKVYEVDCCFSYQKKNRYKLGTVDTVLHFLYGNYIAAKYFNTHKGRLERSVQKIIALLEKHANSLEPKERFKIPCVGYEKTIVDIKREMWKEKAYRYRPQIQ